MWRIPSYIRQYTIINWRICFPSIEELEAYTSRILASQQTAHEAEIAKWIALSQANEQVAALAQKRADKAERVCAMKDEAAEKLLHALALYQVGENLSEVFALGADLRKTISASPQQVSEWERKKLEPLRTQVAMLHSLVQLIYDGKQVWNLGTLAEVINNTKTTAEQFIAECEQRGAVKALEDAIRKIEQRAGEDSFYSNHAPTFQDAMRDLKEIADGLRATSKKAG